MSHDGKNEHACKLHDTLYASDLHTGECSDRTRASQLVTMAQSLLQKPQETSTPELGGCSAWTVPAKPSSAKIAD